MRSFRCPICKEWIHVPKYTVDFVHKCIKANKTRMKADTEFWKIPNRINLKIDKKDCWNNLGMNPRQPDKKKDKADIEDNIYEDINVETFITLDEL